MGYHCAQFVKGRGKENGKRRKVRVKEEGKEGRE
jgi:hypothetical protein